MEKLIFSNKYLNKDYSFEEPINQLTDKALIKILKKENYRNEDSGLFVTSLNNISISELFQIKINVSNVGVFVANFEKEKINDETKKTLIDDISKLKTEGEISDEEQFEKIRNVLNILNKFGTIFITFSNVQNFKVEKDDFVKLINKDDFHTYVLFLNAPKVVKTKEVKNKESNEKKSIEVISFKDFAIDYTFFSIFCFIASFSLILGLIMSFNSDSLSILLFILTGAFFGIYSYAIFKYMNDYKKWSFDFQKLKFLVLLSLAGIILGIVIGYLVGYFVIKPTEGKTINYRQSLAIAIPVSIAIFVLGVITGYIIYKIKNKMKAK